jgi:flagellin-like hook-associated protein FlgL
MGLSVTTNLAALNSHRNLSATDGQMGRSLEKLSSGLRINRAADDAAGLAISEGLRSQIGGLKVAVRNTQDGISLAQTAEGALATTHAILQRMRDLSVQAANTGALNDEATEAVRAEMTSLTSELDRIAATTAWNGIRLLDGSYLGTFQVGANAGERITVGIGTPMSAAGLGVLGLDVPTVSGSAPTTYSFRSGPVFPGPGEVAVSTSASDIHAAVLTWRKPIGTADFSGPAHDVSAYRALDGALAFGGRTFDLSSVVYDASADTDGNGSVDSDDLLAQLNAAATAALGLDTAPFFTPPASDALQFYVRDAVPGYTDALLGMGTALSDSPGDLARATPTFGSSGGGLSSIDAAITVVSRQRADLGAVQNRFEHTIRNLDVALENLTASESRIRDADMAQEMVRFVRSQVLSQAGTSMLAQANQAAQNVLSLLR